FRPHCRPSAGIAILRSVKDLYRVGATGLEPVTPSVSISGASLEMPEKQGRSEQSDVSLHVRLHNRPEDPDLQRILDAWPKLPERVRRAILTLAAGGRWPCPLQRPPLTGAGERWRIGWNDADRRSAADSTGPAQSAHKGTWPWINRLSLWAA